MRALYSALFYLLLPLIVLRMLWRSRRAPAYRQRLAERFGFFSCPARVSDGPVIWVHAVSVGETLAAAPLVEDLLREYPDHRLVVTTTTPTGSERVRALFGDRVFHVYSPWDMPGPVKRFLARVRPQLLVIMETELWPNLLHYSRQSGCRILLANARLSARSARGYRRVAGLTRQMLGQLDAVACQSPADGERLVALGLPPQRLQVTGSIKFDIDLDQQLRQQAAELKAALGRPVLLGSSTHDSEEALILNAFEALRRDIPDLLCLLVPRHPERFGPVFQLCKDRGYDTARRSAAELPGPRQPVLLGDTMGELRLLSGVASVCVIGGSFIEHGGQNVLEAAAWGVPVVSGPHMFNFAEITSLLVAAGGMQQVSAAELPAALLALLADEARRHDMGRAAADVVAANRGARGRLLAMIREQLAGT
ncbi:3-deoxy-D-manno-octulosonic acid transferase [Seongchinamella sediminis]|uniref:3-deoxy-D-manno-octulosonic acid transferase n=1 Tax=Seongchinamella sediminis TaxID=2283635 RepID=A0A3L7DZQ3_9GAMM|nr:lipid IV(A) 3-deoxy-D-manno-octulosonic acid transferase [Seongchinamella sediminis]RLQ22145.1 3-deoxy-D-manno-octulosonic acid transferase [Seongchinamella sediminis]